MAWSIHQSVLGIVFALALAMGALVNKTNFCTMGAVSDWVNMDDGGRMRSWLLAIGVAVGGVLLLEWAAGLQLPNNTFPPYRSANFAWPRYLLGGAMFGVGMTLASGCGNKTLVRLGGGNLKSLVVLGIISSMAYLMLWTDFYAIAFDSWMAPLAVNLGRRGIASQELGALAAAVLGADSAQALHRGLALAICVGCVGYALSSRRFRADSDLILGGLAVGLSVVACWYLTGGAIGQQWREFADMADLPPARVQVQSLTFISATGDLAHYLLESGKTDLITFGIVSLAGVLLGSFLYAIASGNFRLEWFPSWKDFVSHAAGAVLMGVGGVLAMGCSIGQGVTGLSTLAAGSVLAVVAMVAAAAATMKLQYRFS